MADSATTAVLDRSGLDALIKALGAHGRTVVGPTVLDGAVVLAELSTADRLPFGWGSEVGAGRYRLVPRAERAAFAHTAGPFLRDHQIGRSAIAAAFVLMAVIMYGMRFAVIAVRARHLPRPGTDRADDRGPNGHYAGPDPVV